MIPPEHLDASLLKKWPVHWADLCKRIRKFTLQRYESFSDSSSHPHDGRGLEASAVAYTHKGITMCTMRVGASHAEVMKTGTAP